MKQKNRVRIGLDIILVLITIVLYKKNVISLAFHEIAGLVLFGCLVIHLVLNQKWIRTISIRILDPTLPKRTKVSYVVNLLLFAAWFLVGLSGVLISKIVFHFSIQGPFKIMHVTGAAAALALMGVHVGLHWNYIRNMSRRWLLRLGRSAKPAGVILLAGVILFGAYSMVDSNYISWLTMPFSSGESPSQKGNRNPSGQQQGGSNRASQILSNNQRMQNNQNHQGSSPDAGNGVGANSSGGFISGRANRGSQPDGGGKSMGGRGSNQQFSLLNLLSTAACFFSIMMLFATLTAFINWKLTQSRRMVIPSANPVILPLDSSKESQTSAIGAANESAIEQNNQ